MIHLLTKIVEVIALLCVILSLFIFAAITRYIVNRTRPKRIKPKEEKEINMSKEAREGVTFNDIFMFMIAVPLVLLWVGFAGAVIYAGLGDSSVLASIESYTTLIAILGGPALLIIKDALDVWKQEQDVESKAQEQEHKMENKK